MIWHPARRYLFSARFFSQIFIDLQISFSLLRHARHTRDVFRKNKRVSRYGWPRREKYVVRECEIRQKWQLIKMR